MLTLLTGASGSGKTTIAKALQARTKDIWQVYYFDSIGVLSAEDMIRDFGSGEEWQRQTTHAWMRRLAVSANASAVLLEGQIRIAFLQEALTTAGITSYRILLIDCDDETRARRLCQDRNSPHLASEIMMNWATYLRHEAQRGGHRILDTASLSVDECVEQILHAPST